MPVVGGRYIKKAKGESLESVRSKYAHQCTKALTKEAKLVKGFVQQKLVRKLADLKKEGSKEGAESSADFVKCLRDLDAVKALPHVKVGEAGSRRVMATAPDADACAAAAALSTLPHQLAPLHLHRHQHQHQRRARWPSHGARR